jgi:hypothetical protein
MEIIDDSLVLDSRVYSASCLKSKFELIKNNYLLLSDKVPVTVFIASVGQSQGCLSRFISKFAFLCHKFEFDSLLCQLP